MKLPQNILSTWAFIKQFFWDILNTSLPFITYKSYIFGEDCLNQWQCWPLPMLNRTRLIMGAKHINTETVPQWGKYQLLRTFQVGKMPIRQRVSHTCHCPNLNWVCVCLEIKFQERNFQCISNWKNQGRYMGTTQTLLGVNWILSESRDGFGTCYMRLKTNQPTNLGLLMNVKSQFDLSSVPNWVTSRNKFW